MPQVANWIVLLDPNLRQWRHGDGYVQVIVHAASQVEFAVVPTWVEIRVEEAGVRLCGK